MNSVEYLIKNFTPQTQNFNDALEAYSIALSGIGARDSLFDDGLDKYVHVFSAAEKPICEFAIPAKPMDEADVVQLLRGATSAISDFTKSQKNLLSDVISGAMATYAASKGLDPDTDFKDVMQIVIAALKEKCEERGVDFDSLSENASSFKL